MPDTFDQFLLWEARSRDTIDFKTIYVDMADDLLAGLLLSQIVYWHLPNRDGKTKLRVRRDGCMWLSKADNEWYDEVRLTEKQARRARTVLVEKGLIECRTYKFAGSPKTHTRILRDAFLKAWEFQFAPQGESIRPDGQDDTPQGASELDPQGATSTETTPETTSIWESVLSEIALIVGRGTFSSRYQHTALLSLNNTHAEVQCGDVEWFDTQGRAMVERQLSAVAGRDVSVAFRGPGESPGEC